MEKMKSALEIALERSKVLDGSAKKEIEEIEQQQYIKAAASLGRSFLQGKESIEKIKESIMNYPEKSRGTALKAFLQEITGEMNLANTPAVLKAVAILKDDEKTRQACAEADKL